MKRRLSTRRGRIRPWLRIIIIVAGIVLLAVLAGCVAFLFTHQISLLTVAAGVTAAVSSLAALLAAIKKLLTETQSVFSTFKSSFSSAKKSKTTDTEPETKLPVRYPYFRGHNDQLERLDTTLYSGETSGRTPSLQSTQICALTGKSGIGKTQLAIEYAYRNINKYNVIIWLRADTRANLLADIQAAIDHFGWQPEEQYIQGKQGGSEQLRSAGQQIYNTLVVNLTGSQSVAPKIGDAALLDEKAGPVALAEAPGRHNVIEQEDFLRQFQRELRRKKRWLLILDDVKDQDPDLVAGVLPSNQGGHVILTTLFSDPARFINRVGESIVPIEITGVSEDEGAELLLRSAEIITKDSEKASKDDWEDAKSISEINKGYPLALKLAGAYIKQKQISLRDYRAQSDRWVIEALERQKKYDHLDVGIMSLIMLLENIARTNPHAAQILLLCAFLDPNTITKELIEAGVRDIFAPQDETKVLDEAEQIIDILLGYSLIERDDSTKLLTIHNMLQGLFKWKMQRDTLHLWAERTVRLVNNVCLPFDEPPGASKKTRELSYKQRYLPHALVCANLIKEHDLTGPEAINLLNLAGASCYRDKSYETAVLFYRCLLTITERDPNPLDRARNLCILASLDCLRKDKSQYAEAERRYQEALVIYRQSFGQSAPEVGMILSHYAMLLRQMGLRKKAQENALQARQIWRTLTYEQQDRWHDAWAGNVDEMEGCGVLGAWGILYLMLFGIPVVLGLIFHSWWALLGGLALMVLISVAGFADWFQHKSNQLARRILSIPLGIAGLLAAWHLRNQAIMAWHLGDWPMLLQLSLAVIVALLGFVLTAAVTYFFLYLFEDIPLGRTFLSYSFLPTFIYTLSICALPLLLAILSGTWWVGISSFVLLLALFIVFYINWAKRIPHWHFLVTSIFSAGWGVLGWLSVAYLHLNFFPSDRLLTSIALMLPFFLIAWVLHSLAYSRLYTIGAEFNLPFLLEHLWVNAKVARFLDAWTTSGIDDWVNFYFGRRTMYRREMQLQEALTEGNIALALTTKWLPNLICDAYLRRGYVYLWLKNMQAARADFISAREANQDDLNSAWMVVWSEFTREQPVIVVAKHLEDIARKTPQDSYAYMCQGVAQALRGNYKEALAEIEQSIALQPDLVDHYFWKGIVCAYLQKDDEANIAIKKSLDLDLPPILLTPLYWLQLDRPDFYHRYAKPLLQEYNL